MRDLSFKSPFLSQYPPVLELVWSTTPLYSEQKEAGCNVPLFINAHFSLMLCIFAL